MHVVISRHHWPGFAPPRWPEIRPPLTLALLDAGASADLLITDLNMPGQDGTALIYATRLRRPGLPVLLLTGDLNDLLSAPPPGLVLRKPVRTQALAKAIAQLLQPDSLPQSIQR